MQKRNFNVVLSFKHDSTRESITTLDWKQGERHDHPGQTDRQQECLADRERKAKQIMSSAMLLHLDGDAIPSRIPEVFIASCPNSAE